MKPPIPYAGKWPKHQAVQPERRIRLVPPPDGDKALLRDTKDGHLDVYGLPVAPEPLRPASADEVKRAVRDGWRDGLLLREIAERTGISLKRIHWAAIRLMQGPGGG